MSVEEEVLVEAEGGSRVMVPPGLVVPSGMVKVPPGSCGTDVGGREFVVSGVVGSGMGIRVGNWSSGRLRVRASTAMTCRFMIPVVL